MCGRIHEKRGERWIERRSIFYFARTARQATFAFACSVVFACFGSRLTSVLLL
jgi:hypothetical protein